MGGCGNSGSRGRRFTVNTALYRVIRNDVLIPRPNQRFEQAGQQSSKGVDLDISGDVGKGIRLIANYGYSLPRFDEYFDSEGTNLSGFRPAYVQLHAGNLWLTKIWKTGFTASIGGRYLGPMFTNHADTIRLGGWTTFGGAFGIRRGIYEWSVNTENLFNRRRYFTASDYDNQVYPGPPINVFTTLRFRFSLKPISLGGWCESFPYDGLFRVCDRDVCVSGTSFNMSAMHSEPRRR